MPSTNIVNTNTVSGQKGLVNKDIALVTISRLRLPSDIYLKAIITKSATINPTMVSGVNKYNSTAQELAMPLPPLNL